MDIGEFSSKYAKYTSGMNGDTNLSKKYLDELSKNVVGVVETNKNQEFKIFKSWNKTTRDERSLRSTKTLC